MITVTNVIKENSNTANMNIWLVDSGASDHMTSNKTMSNLKTLEKEVRVGLPDGSIKTVKELGTVRLNDDIVLTNVFHVDGFKHNLLSVSKLVKEKQCQIMSNNV